MLIAVIPPSWLLGHECQQTVQNNLIAFTVFPTCFSRVQVSQCQNNLNVTILWKS